jgi:toxin ParE1/3/4
MIYRLLPQAERDLEAITDFIAEYDPGAALKLVQRFQERWELLSNFPLTGQRRPDLDQEARHVIVGPYLTLYRIREDTVEIVRILHGRRNITSDTFG